MNTPRGIPTSITHEIYDKVLCMQHKGVSTYHKRTTNTVAWSECTNLAEYNTLLDLKT